MHKALATVKRKSEVKAAQDGCFDVIVVGGGIHGVTICREAALKGYRVLLLEAKDYAFGTSSRSSKMLHGGVRYLEQGDFGLVGEALRERGLIIKNAPHLASMQEFFFPIISGLTRPAWQVKIGLSFYDLLARYYSFFTYGVHSESLSQSSVVSNLSVEASKLRKMGLKFSTLYRYVDAQMDDARITVENVVDSKALGATALNYARVREINCEFGSDEDKSVVRAGQLSWNVRWCCELSGAQYKSKARFLVNAAGSWVSQIQELVDSADVNTCRKELPQVVFSRGSHLLFNVPWRFAGLILPTGTKGRYYFVWPYYTPESLITLVGTTDCHEKSNIEDPLATSDEVSELLGFLERDLPNSGLNASSLYQTFSGLRTLVMSAGNGIFRGSKKSVSNISRTHSWIETSGYIALLGGKFTNSRATAEEASERIDKYFDSAGEDRACGKSTRTRPLPGGVGWSEQVKESLVRELLDFFMSKFGESSGVSAKLCYEQEVELEVRRAVDRFGVRASYLMRDDCCCTFCTSVLSAVLVGQMRYAIIEEQANTIEDVMRRRLGLALLPGGGGHLLNELGAQMRELLGRSEAEIKAEIVAYTKRWLGQDV